MRGALNPSPEAITVPAAAIGIDEFTALMEGFGPFPERVAIAVSGGPDSMTLVSCVKLWMQERSPPPLAGGAGGGGTKQSRYWDCITPPHLTSPAPAFAKATAGLGSVSAEASGVGGRGEGLFIALIVDHGLRPESANEAEETQKRLTAIGIESEILRWEHAPLVTRIHASARKARYRLLLDACRRHGIATLLLAHQMEDQAETVLMRLAKGSGIDGLAGMNGASMMDGIRLLRPFLNVPKERLIATCHAAGVKFIEDASNRSDKFARGRLRKVMPLLAEEGLSIERLTDLATRAGEAKDALDHYTREFLRVALHRDEAGVIRIDLEQFRAVPRAIAGRALALVLRDIHAGDYAPEHAPLMRLRDALCAPDDMTPRTLHGCLVGKTATQAVVMREFAAITDVPAIRPGESVIWDGRWRITLNTVIPDNFPDVLDIREVDPESRLASDAEKNKLDSGFLSHARESSVFESADRPFAQVTGPGMTKGEFSIRPLGSPPHEVLDALAPGLRKSAPQGRARASLPALWQEGQLRLIPSLKNEGPVRAQLVTIWPLL